MNNTLESEKNAVATEAPQPKAQRVAAKKAKAALGGSDPAPANPRTFVGTSGRTVGSELQAPTGIPVSLNFAWFL